MLWGTKEKGQRHERLKYYKGKFGSMRVVGPRAEASPYGSLEKCLHLLLLGVDSEAVGIGPHHCLDNITKSKKKSPTYWWEKAWPRCPLTLRRHHLSAKSPCGARSH